MPRGEKKRGIKAKKKDGKGGDKSLPMQKSVEELK